MVLKPIHRLERLLLFIRNAGCIEIFKKIWENLEKRETTALIEIKRMEK
jgi:hypothetical protein